MFKRISLFMLTYIAVMVMVTIILQVFGIEPYLQANGINYTSLMIMCGVFGMVGSFISLSISKWSAKRTGRVPECCTISHVVDIRSMHVPVLISGFGFGRVISLITLLKLTVLIHLLYNLVHKLDLCLEFENYHSFAST